MSACSMYRWSLCKLWAEPRPIPPPQSTSDDLIGCAILSQFGHFAFISFYIVTSHKYFLCSDVSFALVPFLLLLQVKYASGYWFAFLNRYLIFLRFFHWVYFLIQVACTIVRLWLLAVSFLICLSPYPLSAFPFNLNIPWFILILGFERLTEGRMLCTIARVHVERVNSPGGLGVRQETPLLSGTLWRLN